MSIRKKYLGNYAFYNMILRVAVPIIIQNGITNFVGLLDNIMIGRIGTIQMSAIAIGNQLLLVFNLAVFGALSGAGIFGAQYYGNADHKGVQRIFRYKLYVGLLITVLGVGIFLTRGDALILLYLSDGSEAVVQTTLGYGRTYLFVMLTGLLPYMVEEAYASTLRECGETTVPMIGGIVAVFVNLILNYLLIYGKLGFPAMGVLGAAIATVIARYIQALIVIIWTHLHGSILPFILGVYREWSIPIHLVKTVTQKGMPLMINELLWSSSQAILNQCYSVRGLDAVAAINISTTISNLFNIVFVAIGSAIGIVVGQKLGAGEMEEAKDIDTKMIVFCVMSSVTFGILMFLIGPLFPECYNTEEQVKLLAAELLRVAACCMPLWAFTHATYFTLRTGGKTIVTFLFDCVFAWVVVIPAAYGLSRFTVLPIVPLYLCCQLLEIIKCVIGYILVKKGVWINNLVR